MKRFLGMLFYYRSVSISFLPVYGDIPGAAPPQRRLGLLMEANKPEEDSFILKKNCRKKNLPGQHH